MPMFKVWFPRHVIKTLNFTVDAGSDSAKENISMAMLAASSDRARNISTLVLVEKKSHVLNYWHRWQDLSPVRPLAALIS